MIKNPMANIFFSIISVFMVFIVILAYSTQSAGIQLIAIQKIYWSLDTSWAITRIIAMVLITVVGIIILFRSKSILKLSMKICLLMVLIGLILGLSIIYGYSCCDMPVSFLMGFPLSWLRGVSDVQNHLSSPVFQYLSRNIFNIKWSVDYFCFIVDIIFWYNAGIIVYLIINRSKITLSPKG
jgi:hypothetical protein